MTEDTPEPGEPFTGATFDLAHAMPRDEAPRTQAVEADHLRYRTRRIGLLWLGVAYGTRDVTWPSPVGGFAFTRKGARDVAVRLGRRRLGLPAPDRIEKWYL